MGLIAKLKQKMKEQETESAPEKKKGGSFHTGSRLPNKRKDDNIYGDKQARKEGSGGPPRTPREKQQRKSFR